jgi:predicted Zn-dependent protease with MMP-like domain
MPFHVAKQRFGQLVERALAELPEPFSTYMDEIAIEVRPRPSRRQLEHAGLDEHHLLLGLYVGRPRTLRGVEDSATLPDFIFIFQDNIEQVSDSEITLERQIRTTVLHEIGHHFGMDEDDLDKLGYG